MNHSPSASSRVGSLLGTCPVVAVIRIDSAGRAVDLARTLVEAGLYALEITLRTPAACAAIERIRAEVPEANVGAGTVLNPHDLERVTRAGARFAIAPGCTGTLYRAAVDLPLPLVPGVATASEIMRGLEQGHECFKFFPAQAAGGAELLKAWSGPFPNARFIPTGGVTVDNAPRYLALANVMAVGGSWMVPEDAIAAGDWERIAGLARACQNLKQST
ncbi:MAG: bifunctional 4-hydroxy-2-oxoglutarate aldolase/2-dehydro-3-deoxy-phosphogluconate aldolase [Wenzhouxiangella sp.]|nr:MAG: bifunctional 4-hydroxy-2-oxoglutarate aldolase/2-dehydro-3-deoxy-phosphogluconate aldolase [Wenzhouxiangella sp.]